MTVYGWLYLIPAFFAFVWPVLVLLVKERPSKAQWLISAALFMTGCAMVLYSTYFSKKLEYEYFLSFLASVSALFCAPMFYMYICVQTSMKGITYRARRFFLPSFLMSGILAIVALIGKAEYYKRFVFNAIHLGDLSLTGDYKYDAFIIFNYYGFFLVLLLEIIFVVTYSCFKMVQYDRLLNDYYDSNDHILTGSKLRIIVYAILVLGLALIIGYHPFHEIKSIPLVFAISLVECFLLSGIGWYTYNLKYTADELSSKLQKSDKKYRKQSSLKDSYIKSTLHSDFVEIVEKKQAYLNPNTSLDSLSEKLHVSQSVLVDLINDIYGCSFAEYLDGLRISKAVGMIMVETKNKKSDTLNSRLMNIDYIESVALQCGFSSIVSFYSGFKLVMGQSYDSWINES